jgi:hypothetical protein
MRRPTLPLVGLIAVLAGRSAAAQSPMTLVVRDTAVLAAAELGESSGLAPSRRAGAYWTINDSGSEPVLYLIDSSGADAGRVRVAGARNVDWEDLAAGPCPPPTHGRCLYVADTGDNGSRRSSVSIYVLREPDLPTGPADTLRTAAVLGATRLRYPTGPRDAEGLAVLRAGTVLLATKPRTGEPELYEVSIRPGSTIVARPLATLPIPANVVTGSLVTGIALAPDGRLLAVRTYRHVYFFHLRDGALEPAAPATGVLIPVVESQGEAVTFEGPDRMVLSSERGYRRHAILTRLSISRSGR